MLIKKEKPVCGHNIYFLMPFGSNRRWLVVPSVHPSQQHSTHSEMSSDYVFCFHWHCFIVVITMSTM